MKPTTPVRKFTTVDKFVEAVNACSRTYAEQKGNGNAYKAEISALFQVAKQQNLTLPRKHIWGESGI